MENVRIRYGYVFRGSRKGHRKSVLITQQIGPQVVFGISKCNLDEDKWERDLGKKIAFERVSLSMRLPSPAFKESIDFPGVRLHQSGLFGWCNVESVKNLIEYFRRATDCSK